MRFFIGAGQQFITFVLNVVFPLVIDELPQYPDAHAV